jgi:hypothetical protein
MPREFRTTVTHPDGSVSADVSPARHVDAMLARARRGSSRIKPTPTGGVVITRKVRGHRMTVVVEPVAA